MLPGTQVSSRARTRALFDEEQKYIAPGLQTIALVSGLAIDHGRGVTLVDLDGRTYLDLNAGVSVASLGHSHPKYVAALTAQLEAVTVGSFTSRARAELVRLMADLAPGDLSRTQFFSGGAEAVEAAIRLARSYTKRTDIIGFTGGFHGKTAGVLPLSDVGWKDAVGPLPPGHHLAPYADPTRFDGPADACAEAAIAALRLVIETKADGRPAAILIEPVQGTAGNVVPPDGFLARVHAVAREYGALLIADEMITGFGRTGRLFGCNHDGVTPDIMTMGKGIASGYPGERRDVDRRDHGRRAVLAAERVLVELRRQPAGGRGGARDDQDDPRGSARRERRAGRRRVSRGAAWHRAAPPVDRQRARAGPPHRLRPRDGSRIRRRRARRRRAWGSSRTA